MMVRFTKMLAISAVAGLILVGFASTPSHSCDKEKKAEAVAVANTDGNSGGCAKAAEATKGGCPKTTEAAKAGCAKGSQTAQGGCTKGAEAQGEHVKKAKAPEAVAKNSGADR